MCAMIMRRCTTCHSSAARCNNVIGPTGTCVDADDAAVLVLTSSTGDRRCDGAVVPDTRMLMPHRVWPRFQIPDPDRKSTRLNSSHVAISYAVFCLKKKK